MATRKKATTWHPQYKKYKYAPAVREATSRWAELYSEALRMGENERRRLALANAVRAIHDAVEQAKQSDTRTNPRGRRTRASSTAATRRHTKAAGVALLDGRLGTAIAHGAKALHHAVRRSNPPLPVRKFNGRRGHLVSTQVLSVDYHNAGSAQRSAYTHEFRPTVEMWALDDGTLLLRGPGGRRVWDDFYVRDAE